VLFDAEFARAIAARIAQPEGPMPAVPREPVVPALPPARESESTTTTTTMPAKALENVASEPDLSPALQLLALLQREGRLVDFLEEDVAMFSDADIGAAARVVHAGCRKAIREHVTVEPVRAEAEGARVTLDAAASVAGAIKFTGNVHGSGPFTGVLRHRGWRVTSITLPTAVGTHDVRVVAQAEVEL